jgi:hypothetical protein
MLLPGLGHAYLREWIRAVLWFSLLVGASAIMAPTLYTESGSVSTVIEANRQLPLRTHLTLFAVRMLSVGDAYWMATLGNQRLAAAEGETCPYCGRELDEDIDFCHWCTTELTDVGEDRTVQS